MESHCSWAFNELELSAEQLMAREKPDSLMELGAVRGETTTFPRLQDPDPAELTAADDTEAPSLAWLNDGYRFHRRATKPVKGEFSTATRWLEDMVKICTEAHRAGARDLLWMSWLPNKKRKTFPTRYSGLIALTSEGARKLMLNFDVWFPKPSHWDCLLLEKLSAHAGMRAELSAGYLYPCLGHYSQHESAVEKGGPRNNVGFETHPPRDENGRARSRPS